MADPIAAGGKSFTGIVLIDPATGNPYAAAGTVAALDLVDRSGTTSSTAGNFTPVAAANGARQFLRVTNKAGAGTLYVWDKTSGAPNASNTISLAPGASYTWDAKVPKGPIQVGGSAASMPYEAAEG